MSNTQSASEVRIAKSIGYRIIAKKAVRAVLWLILVALVVYAIIASSMTRFVATDLGTLKIVSPNFPGGYAPVGTAVVVDPEGGYDGNPIQNLLAAVTPHGGILIAEIVEGPYGSPDWSSYAIEREKDSKLTNEYIAECLQGCEADGTYVVIRSDQIMGIQVVE